MGWVVGYLNKYGNKDDNTIILRNLKVDLSVVTSPNIQMKTFLRRKMTTVKKVFVDNNY